MKIYEQIPIKKGNAFAKVRGLFTREKYAAQGFANLFRVRTHAVGHAEKRSVHVDNPFGS